MKALTKFFAGAAAAAALTVTAASPAQAQIFGRDGYDRGGIDAGDIVTGVAVIGGLAAILGAFNRDGGRYGSDNRYRYRNDYQAAVNACAHEAERYGRGSQVSVTDVDRRGYDNYRVRGVIDAGYGNDGYGRYDRGYDARYDPRSDDRYGSYGRYEPRNDRYGRYEPRNDRYGRYEPRNDRYGRYDPRDDRYGRNNYGRYDQRVEFDCEVRADGRIRDFDIDRA